MSNEDKLRKKLDGYSQSDDVLINNTARLVYSCCQLRSYRQRMLDTIEHGTSEEKKQRQESIGIKQDNYDPEEDKISKEVLGNWRSLTKEVQMNYCRYIAINSIDIQADVLVKKEQFKQKIKDKLSKKLGKKLDESDNNDESTNS